MWKKSLVLLLVICLILTLFSGCKKDDEQPEKDDSVVTDNNGDSEKDKDSESEENEENENISYVLYLTHEELPYIYGEKFEIASNDAKLKDRSIEEIVLEHLISFEKTENFITPIPKGTKLLSLEKKDGIVYVDLSKEFVLNMKKEKTSTEVAIASIVNTLVFFQDNKEVVITVEGKTIDKLNGVEMNKGFTFIEGFVPDK